MLIKYISVNVRGKYGQNVALVLAFIKSMCKANERNERTEFQDSDGNWWCYCKVDGAEELIGLSKSAASRALKRAEEHGLIKSYVRKGLDHTKHYTLTDFGQSESRGASMELQVGNRKAQDLTENEAENTNSHAQSTEFPHEFPPSGKSLIDYNMGIRSNGVIDNTGISVTDNESNKSITGGAGQVDSSRQSEVFELHLREVQEYWYSHGVFIGRDIDSMSETARQNFYQGFAELHPQDYNQFMSILGGRLSEFTGENSAERFMKWYDSIDRVNGELESKTA